MAFKRFFMLPLCVLALPLMASAQGAEELIDPTRPVAFVAPVGKKTVKVGDVVDQAKILAIGPGRVSFEKNGEKGELVLLPTVSKPVRVEE
jgi:hypothetical protein